ncbi:MAG: 2-amino-4-hydroxy-6-hydroxymethyldihydropteridine diphosphokinase [Pseudoxanthomonas sp.]|nr:2-amino-4-hydroxy-6-hydroxymethyldihydropteridine diphosphokinase [Pseudoxanthomonas sp.]
MSSPVPAFIGLGGNLGDAAGTLRSALLALERIPRSRLVSASRLFRTPAWGRQQQPDFINAAAHLETSLPPRELLEALLAIEREFGRERDPAQRWGPRTLDLDLLLYAQTVMDEPGLRLPHPHLHERAFALLPLLEVAPDLHIPGHGAASRALIGLDASAIQPLG